MHNCNEHFPLNSSGVERGEQSLALPNCVGTAKLSANRPNSIVWPSSCKKLSLVGYFFSVGCFLGEFLGCGFRFQLVALAVWCRDLLQECQGCWLQVGEGSALGLRVHLEEPCVGMAFSVFDVPVF